MADFLGTVHHSYTYTVQEGLDAIREVIRMIETYDTTTIRASTPMFLMSRKIKAMGVKMVLSGEGADEASVPSHHTLQSCMQQPVERFSCDSMVLIRLRGDMIRPRQ